MSKTRKQKAAEMTLVYQTLKKAGELSIADLATECAMSMNKTRSYIDFFLWYGVVDFPQTSSPAKPTQDTKDPACRVTVTSANRAFVEEQRFKTPEAFFYDAFVEIFADTGSDFPIEI